MESEDFDKLHNLISFCSDDTCDTGQKVIGKRTRLPDAVSSTSTRMIVEFLIKGSILQIDSASSLLKNLNVVAEYYIALSVNSSSPHSIEMQRTFLYYCLVLMKKLYRHISSATVVSSSALGTILSNMLNTWEKLKSSASSLENLRFIELTLEFIDIIVTLSPGEYSDLSSSATISTVLEVVGKEFTTFSFGADGKEIDSLFFISGH